MKLLLLGARPPKAIEAFRAELSRAGLTLVEAPEDPHLPPPLVVAYQPQDIDELPLCAALRIEYPDSFFALIVPAVWLNDSEQTKAVMSLRPQLDDIWVEGFWQQLLPMYAQKAHRQHELNLCLREVAAEQGQLVASSDALIRQLERDVHLAGEIQRAFLPRTSPSIAGVSILAKYVPAAGLGGDYYDIFEFGDKKHYGILLADSKTHGMAAALLSALLSVRLEEMKDRFPDSKSFVEHLAAEISQSKTKQTSLSLLYGILDRANLTFEYTTAGALTPIVWRDGKLVPVPESVSAPLGSAQLASPVVHTLELQPGDRIVFHTDGWRGPLAETLLPPKQAIQKMLSASAGDPRALQNELLGLVDRYKDRRQLTADLTLLQLYIDPKALFVRRKLKSVR